VGPRRTKDKKEQLWSEMMEKESGQDLERKMKARYERVWVRKEFAMDGSMIEDESQSPFGYFHKAIGVRLRFPG